MYAVITHVRLKAGRIDDIREVFRRRNEALFAGQDDWVSTIFTANRRDEEVTIVSRWTNKDSYHRFAAGQEYGAMMADLEPYFAHRPTVDVNEILVEIGND